MKIETLRERIEKAEEKINKKNGTIQKKTKLIEKKTAQLEKTADTNERRWIEFDIRNLEDDIKRLGREIEETEKTIETYRAQLAGEIERQSSWIKEVPETLKKLHEELIERWDGYDIERRNFLCEKYREMDYREFMKTYHIAGYDFMHKTDSQIHAENTRDAESAILNLLNRVKAITGEVTDWGRLEVRGGALNGYVAGKEGRCVVETIGAGGYNIQRYHLRVLVKPIN